MDASHCCQSSAMTAPTIRHFHSQPGSFLMACYTKSSPFSHLSQVLVLLPLKPGPALMSGEIDCHVLKWTFDALDEDHELEQFFEAVPAFCTSQVVHEPRRKLPIWDLAMACYGFLSRTFSSRLLSERIKERRFILCMQAIDALDFFFPTYDFVVKVVSMPVMDGVLQSVQLGHLLRSRCHSSRDATALYAHMLVAGIIASVPERDDRWKVLVMDQLRISKDILEDYLAHGDSVLLANWIHIAPQFFPFYRENPWISVALGKIQSIISKFDIRNTLPGLQHDFCALWNEFAEEAHDSNLIISLFLF
jgi:hypothetical protein